MMVMEQKRGRGRPRQYLDDADRVAAYRERVADRAARAEAALTILRRPSLDLVVQLIDRVIEGAADPEHVRAQIVARISRPGR